jgi:hypothetical protein
LSPEGAQKEAQSLARCSAATVVANSPTIVRRHYAAWLPEAHPEAVEFDTPTGPAPMVTSDVANLRVEAQRRGLRLLLAE